MASYEIVPVPESGGTKVGYDEEGRRFTGSTKHYYSSDEMKGKIEEASAQGNQAIGEILKEATIEQVGNRDFIRKGDWDTDYNTHYEKEVKFDETGAVYRVQGDEPVVPAIEVKSKSKGSILTPPITPPAPIIIQPKEINTDDLRIDPIPGQSRSQEGPNFRPLNNNDDRITVMNQVLTDTAIKQALNQWQYSNN
jgi:hypothetical protein